MSLYNLMFGVNAGYQELLSALGITADDVPRFRDCYVEDDKICIYTRTGGNNRDWYDNAAAYRAQTGDDGTGPWNDDLRAVPGFLYDEDDDFDNTYASFYFTLPALAAGAGTAETGETPAQSEGRQSGGEAVTPKGQSHA